MTARRYVVGGAVRDALLGLPAADRDWVVVGATPDELIAQGLRPVGKDFPVFIDPASGEEVALARVDTGVDRTRVQKVLPLGSISWGVDAEQSLPET